LAGILAAAGNDIFESPRPGRVFQFPRDQGAHPEFQTEWWYFTGHLESAAGESFGYQLTFFRAGLQRPDPRARSAWVLNNIYFAHLAVTDPQGRTFTFREKADRGALGLSGAAAESFKVWINSWKGELKGEEFFLYARDQGMELDLTLKPLKPPALHGQEGYSRKAAGHPAASYYYSLTRMETRGRLALHGRPLEVKGQSWMDHEFFTGSLAPGQVGWDWFALQLSDGCELMLYLLRDIQGKPDPASSGTLIDPQGRTCHLPLSDFQAQPLGTWKSPHTGAAYPAGWEITIPRAGYRLTLTPTLADQEVRSEVPARIAYWEGQVKIVGEKRGQPVAGKGYVELTGYAGPLGGWF
jgi:predicted secreted hydrolase